MVTVGCIYNGFNECINRTSPDTNSYNSLYLITITAENLALLTIDGHLFAQDMIVSYFWMPAVDIASLRRYTFTLPSTETSSSASKEGALYAIHSDHLGTPQVMTNSQQQVVWQAQYQAFGEES